MLIYEIDNVIPAHQQDEIEKQMLHWQHEFPWYHYANTNHIDNQTRAGDSPQFIHGLLRGRIPLSKFSRIPFGIMETLGVRPDQFLRAKANMIVQEAAAKIHPPHIDDPSDHYAFIYYVVDSDGDTCFFEGETIIRQVAPKKGRGVLFNGHIPHASSTPTQHSKRIVINFNLLPDIDLKPFETHPGRIGG